MLPYSPALKFQKLDKNRNFLYLVRYLYYYAFKFRMYLYTYKNIIFIFLNVLVYNRLQVHKFYVCFYLLSMTPFSLVCVQNVLLGAISSWPSLALSICRIRVVWKRVRLGGFGSLYWNSTKSHLCALYSL